jgi:hypothetical protein
LIDIGEPLGKAQKSIGDLVGLACRIVMTLWEKAR